MKKQGSILIEVMASIMILSLTTTFVVSACIQSNNIAKKRILHEEVERSVCNLMKEFKFNVPKKDILSMLDNGEVGFKYDKDFSNKLIEVPIKELEKGSDIEVSKLQDDKFGLKLKIKAEIKRNDNDVLIEKEFTKSWWMDEV
ncbi:MULTISPECIES: hypothetical protein [Clostridium]|jgi:hypothetical protein|uniref:Prepilin-type N-terminal cleavage/methylation domain-containing protein n=1 Tax=Clostridium saccharoperbutylacetonicum N1-4(HMT) TaxID=931276 RepID=M1MP30_9CLOT|nr:MULTISPECIES: hypothetical protein [Clostridium]AGF56491.1 hypothetical protein Cspa_c27260 [Clostridium saccharoperbutylacetonicum N1-4(HMT)]AQR95160.1 hypothetical protein CLSAP_24740 [Clostridium saccharoperbutylacetonicum]NRT62762.1 hypothetical protein [Clostridium saccharoperbutylacetonicum]NSB26114.1 hypothetical protein [Clostridium saccharoperbutylacetonicum]NSB31007.1 hypothetical protein [Clostridium saccharoperbutylacetonicum]